MAAQPSARHRIRASNPSSFSSARLLPRPHPHRTLFLLPVAHCLLPVRHSYSAASTKTAPSTARPLLAHRPRRSVPRLRPPRELVQVLLVQLLPTHRRGIPAYAVQLPQDHRPEESLDPQRLRLLNTCYRFPTPGQYTRKPNPHREYVLPVAVPSTPQLAAAVHGAPRPNHRSAHRRGVADRLGAHSWRERQTHGREDVNPSRWHSATRR